MEILSRNYLLEAVLTLCVCWVGGVLNIYNPKFERTTYLLKIASRGSQKARPDEGLRAALADKAERGGGDAQYLKTKTTWIITRTHHYHDRFMFPFDECRSD